MEIFHRRFRSPEQGRDNEHINRLSKILEATPEEHKKWLKEKLNFSHEPSLKERLKTLLPELESEIFRDLIPDLQSFIRQVGDTRNYFTHYDNSLKGKAKTGFEMFRLYQLSKFILISLIFIELGVSVDLITSMLESRRWIFFYGLEKNSE